jgi:hypothetical protein
VKHSAKPPAKPVEKTCPVLSNAWVVACDGSASLSQGTHHDRLRPCVPDAIKVLVCENLDHPIHLLRRKGLLLNVAVMRGIGSEQVWGYILRYATSQAAAFLDIEVADDVQVKALAAHNVSCSA